MKYYARIDDNKVIEVIELPDEWILGVDIFTSSFAEQCIPCEQDITYGMIYENHKFSLSSEPEMNIDEVRTLKILEIQSIIIQQEQKAQRSSQEITKALLLKQEASQADIEAFTALHSAKKLNQAKLLEVANATSKEQIEAINAIQVEYKNGEWLEV